MRGDCFDFFYFEAFLAFQISERVFVVEEENDDFGKCGNDGNDTNKDNNYEYIMRRDIIKTMGIVMGQR